MRHKSNPFDATLGTSSHLFGPGTAASPRSWCPSKSMWQEALVSTASVVSEPVLSSISLDRPNGGLTDASCIHPRICVKVLASTSSRSRSTWKCRLVYGLFYLPTTTRQIPARVDYAPACSAATWSSRTCLFRCF